ncbi:MAG: PQQ-binding-like beta-propeller repeat protein [Candidatus Eisenbacteria bacterium]|nr:PQQ-binding-like beta-propeller repeat protein [Candidatus Eisenbacteria bacterium]
MASGLTLYTPSAGPEALLIDSEGRTVHRWSLRGSSYWARVRMMDDGSLLVITCDPARLMKIDHTSERLWRASGTAHHDLDVDSEGRIYVLMREAVTRDGIHDGGNILDDEIAILDQYGKGLGTVSILDAFRASDRYASWVSDDALPEGPDILHTNSIEVYERDGRREALVSIRSIGTIALIDLDGGGLVWALRGAWRMQHEAHFVSDRILLFDNLGLGDDRSRVIEVDPASGEILWEWTEPGFFSRGAGAVQRLSNGNTLITESENGRIIEIDPSGSVVWEYLNPVTIDRGRTLTLGIMRAERIEQSP